VFPEAIAEFEGEIRLRDALQQCTTSVHLFGQEPSAFDLLQWNTAVQLQKPCVLASCGKLCPPQESTPSPHRHHQNRC
jgi:hypothetical protein